MRCIRNIVLEVVSDQTLLDAIDLWLDQNETIVQTIVQPLTRPNPDHYPADCALQITSDQTQLRSK